MHPQVYISTGTFKSKSLRSVITECLNHSIMNVELSSGIEYDENILQYAEHGHKNGLRYLVHNYFPPANSPFVLNLASDDDVVLHTSMEYCKRAIDLCEKYSAPFFSVHCGFAFHATVSQLGKKLTKAPRFPLEMAEGIFINSINTLCDYSSAKNVSVLIENNVLTQVNLIHGENKLLVGVTADDLMQITRNISYPNFGLLIDTGHLNVSANSLQFSREEFLNKLGDRIIALHLNDNDGTLDNNLPFDSYAWFMPFLGEFNDRTFVLESYRLDIQQIKKSVGIIEEAL